MPEKSDCFKIMVQYFHKAIKYFWHTSLWSSQVLILHLYLVTAMTREKWKKSNSIDVGEGTLRVRMCHVFPIILLRITHPQVLIWEYLSEDALSSMCLYFQKDIDIAWLLFFFVILFWASKIISNFFIHTASLKILSPSSVPLRDSTLRILL